MANFQILHSQELTNLGRDILATAGAPADIAQLVAGSLVKSNLLGHDSHGVMRVPRYVQGIRSGRLDPAARPRLQQQRHATAIIDGQWGFGQLTAQFGANLARELADTFGLGCVALSRANHIGRLGEYAETLAAAGFVAVVFNSGGPPNGAVAPYGGRDRMFGTNPMAWAVPVAETHAPLVVDFATAAAAEGKLAVALGKGESVPPGVLIDRDGNPTTDPAAFYAGGALIPFGGHKGYGLALMMEILASTLAGAAPASSVEYLRPANPTLILAVNIASFVPPEQFQRQVEELLQQIKASRPAEGFIEVLLPGEPEARMLAQRSREGIPIPQATWQELTTLARELGVQLAEQ